MTDATVVTHDWTKSYPRGTWPIYTCDRCGTVKCPTAAEMQSDTPPPWWEDTCTPPKPLTKDDVEWLTGTGHYSQD